jgi:hypothetical protein
MFGHIQKNSKSGFMKRTGLIWIIILLFSSEIFSQDPNFYIYLCFGQSNMQGIGPIEARDKTVDSRFKVYQALDCPNLGRKKGTWYSAVPPTCQCYSLLSPADYFGRTMVANLPDSISVGILNVSIAGCDIRIFDKKLYQDYDSTYTDTWFLDLVKGYGGNPYEYLIDLASSAQQDGVIKGILLHQGETNTGDKLWPSYVQGIYNDMLTDLSLDPDSVPLLAGELVGADQGGCCSSMNPIIDQLPETIPTAHVISSEGCPVQADKAHFTSEGYRIMGRRYAATMLSLMGYETMYLEAECGTVGDSCVIRADMDRFSAEGTTLGQNYPNPFVDETCISFQIPNASYVSLSVFNAFGIKVAEFGGKEYHAGEHAIQYGTENLPAGKYYYTLKTEEYAVTRKMLVLDKK